MENNHDVLLMNNLKKMLIEIDQTLDSYGYEFEKRVDSIYQFLTTCDSHELDAFFRDNSYFDYHKLLTYKAMLILILSTDFYIEINYRVSNNKICVDNQDKILKELEKNCTYKKLIYFFKDPYNEDYAKTIINQFFIFINKDPLYINRCLDSIVKNNKTFKVLAMNPMFDFKLFEGIDEDIIEPEIITSNVLEVYDDTNIIFAKQSVDKNSNDPKTIPYLKIVKADNELESTSFVDLKEDEELDPFFIQMKQRLITKFKIQYPEANKFNEVIAYIISNAYESIKINRSNEYNQLISYLENQHNNEEIVDLFVNDDGFSSCILFEFVKNNKLICHDEIIWRREEIERLGCDEVLKRYNSFYDIENQKYGHDHSAKVFHNQKIINKRLKGN